MDQTETEEILLEKGRADTTSRALETVEKLIRPGRIPSPGNPRPISSPTVESVIYIGVYLAEQFRVSEGVPGIVFGQALLIDRNHHLNPVPQSPCC